MILYSKKVFKKKKQNSCWNQKHLELDQYSFVCTIFWGKSTIQATREAPKESNPNERVAGDKFRGADGEGLLTAKPPLIQKSLTLRRLITQHFKIAQ